MLRLMVYLKPYWKAALMAPLLMVLEVTMDLLQPSLMARIVDIGVADGDIAFIVKTGFLMVSVALIGVVGGIGCTVFSSIAAQNFGTDLRTQLFKKVQSFSFSKLDQFKTASLITRLTNDIVQVQNVVLTMLRILVRAPFLCIGGLIMAVTINWKLALILAFAMPVLMAVLILIIRKGFPLFAMLQKGLDRVNIVMQENLSGVRVVKAFVRSEHEKVRFGNANDHLTDISIKAARIMAMTMPVMMLVMNISVVVVLWLGGIQVKDGMMQVGEIMAFINYLTQILFSLMMVTFMLVGVSRAKASADRIKEVMETQTDIRDKPSACEKPIAKGRIEFKNVFFHYENSAGDPVLKNISFTAEPGQTVAILGATGSGKSTLVNMIPRLYDVTEGQVIIDGIDVREYTLDTLHSGIGMVLQESILFSGTIRENICWGRQNAVDEEIIEAAQIAQAHDFIQNLSDGYQTQLGQRGVNLSGGQKQRLAIARALVKKPVILILDDSTSSVDVGTESRIQRAIRERICATCIVIAQRISTVLEADKILVLEDGRITAEGTHKELMKKSAAYQDIYHSQLGEEAI